MTKEMKKKNNNISSPRNILILFVAILVLLFVYTYLSPEFSNKNLGFNQDNNQGRLYQLVPVKPIPGSDDRKPCPSGSSGDLTCHPFCEGCLSDAVIPPTYYCRPKNGQCPDGNGNIGICYTQNFQGRCSYCSEKCKPGEVCKPPEQLCFGLGYCIQSKPARCVPANEIP